MAAWWTSKKHSLSLLRTVAPSIPYIAVVIGLYGLNSAWTSIILYHLGIVLVLWQAKYWHLGQNLKTGADVLVLVALVLASALSGFLIYVLWVVIRLEELALDFELASLGLSNTAWLIFIFYYFTVNPLLEELFWRGYLGSDSIWPTWNDVWFAGYHILVMVRFVQFPWIVASFLLLVGVAWLWRQLARRYKGLIIPIASHAAADASIIGAVFFLLRGGF